MWPCPDFCQVPRFDAGEQNMNFLESLSWTTLIALALILGLAPFTPEPHIWEKLKMLWAGNLTAPIDIFDLLLHGAPWLLLALKAMSHLRHKEP